MAVIPIDFGTADHAQRGYSIHVEPGLLNGLAANAAEWLGIGSDRRDILVVTDAQVRAHHWSRIETALHEAGLGAQLFTLPSGEAAKSWTWLEQLCDWMLGQHVDRNRTIVALGGGVVGDITGFAAAILKRGCPFVQIPTTLLAQVDSSVGGKTAINTRAGKNMIGAFHQPSRVLIDPDMLDTLPPRELRAGYAEVVKYGLIDDASFFAWCEANGSDLLAGDKARMTHAITHSVQSKARIVAKDEREISGVRALLNLGHTFGHALEADTGFSDRLLHGEAVAAGMALAFRFSARQRLCSSTDADRVTAHLLNVGLPVDLGMAGVQAKADTLVAHMLHDKKRTGDTLPFLLARAIGETFLSRDTDLGDIQAFLVEEGA